MSNGGSHHLSIHVSTFCVFFHYLIFLLLKQPNVFKEKVCVNPFHQDKMWHIRHKHKNTPSHTCLIQYKCVQWILASLSYSCKASQGKRINYKDVLTSSGLYITLHSPIVDICIDTLQMYSWQLVVHNCEQYHNAKH